MASGIIKSYTIPSGATGEGAHWSFEWTSSKKAAGVSTVSWNLYTRGRSVTPTWLKTGCWLSVSYNGTTTRIYAYDGAEEGQSGSDWSFKDKWRSSGSFDVTHNANGYASFTVNFEVYIYKGTHYTNSGIGVLDSLPTQATLTSAPNFTDEQNPTIMYSNPAGNAVTSLQACITNSTGGLQYVKYRDISPTGTSYEFALTDEERNVLRNAIPNSNSLAVRFYIKTVIDGETYFSSMEKTMTIVNASPVLTTAIVDTNTKTTILTGDNKKLVKYYSHAQASMDAVAQKSAAMDLDSYIIRNGSNSAYGSSYTFNNVESNSFSFSASDSRGNTTTKVVTPTMVNYVRLTCNLNSNKPDANGNMTISCFGNYFNGSFGYSSNWLLVQCRYKEHGGSFGNWTTMTASVNGNTYTAESSISGLDYTKAYVFQCLATDALAIVSSAEETVRSIPQFHWGADDFVFEVPVIFNAGATGVESGGGGDSEFNGTIEGDCNITGDLRLKGSGNFGNTLYFGDGSYCYLEETEDDELTIKSSSLYLNTSLYLNNKSVNYGTWTPTLTSSGALSSYSIRQGWYQKLGSVVTIGWLIKATVNSGYQTTGIAITGIPYTPLYDASGGGICSGAYISGGFNFECWVASSASGAITARVQACNNTSAANLSTSASGCFYRSDGGEITIGGTISYITSS